MKPDYSEYLNKPNMLDYIEKEWIEKPQIHNFHAAAINDVIEKYRIKDCLEVGCGTGNVVSRINSDVNYIGIDANERCIEMAALKTIGNKTFDVRDIRGIYNVVPLVELVFTFGFLKHFGLHEWSEIFKKVCSLGEYLVFDMPIAERTYDDGVEYHHVWAAMHDIKDRIDKNGFEILEIKEFGVEPVFICKKKIA